MAIGHNFGCEAYRDAIEAVGREDETTITWRNLTALLNRAGTSVARCFMTNWFVGLQPGNKQVGKFLAKGDDRYEAECRALLLEQIGGLKPQVIMLLGLEVVRRAHQIIPTLQPWSHVASWRAVDEIGSVAMAVDVADMDVTTNVVALLHPSFSNSNRRHRREPEEDMVRSALVGSSISNGGL